MIRSTLLALAGIATATLAYAPAHADTVSLSQWTAAANDRLQKNLFEPMNDDTGTATIRFHRSSDGRAVDIVSSRATSPAIARAAMRSVRRLADLPPLPEGIAPDTLLRAEVMYGSGNPVRYQAARKAMLARAEIANAKFAAAHPTNELAANVAPR